MRSPINGLRCLAVFLRKFASAPCMSVCLRMKAQDMVRAPSAPKVIAVTSLGTHQPVVASQPSRQFSRWVAAFLLLLIMLRNVVLGSAVAWAFAFFLSRGNFFSTTPPKQQSRETFLASCVVFAIVISSLKYGCIASIRCVFRRQPSGGAQRNRAHLVRFAKRVARGSAFHIALSIASSVIVAAIFTASWFPPSLAPLRLDFYSASLISHYVFAATDVVARRITRQESLKISVQQQLQSSLIASRDSRPSVREVLRAYRKTLTLYLPVLIAGFYVQLTSQWMFSTSSKFASDAFVFVSLAFKILIQEIAKRYLKRRGVKLLHVMCVFVSFPTILIDTQVRVVILGLNNTQSTLLRTYAMSVLEILLRLIKVLILRRSIDNKSHIIQSDASHQSNRDKSTATKRLGMCTSFEQWRKQQVDLHIAETFADMYAEYIAIGCSAAITFCFGNDTSHYRLGNAKNNTTGHTGLAGTLAIQVLVETVTDYLSSVMEMYLARIDGSHEISRLGGFLGVLAVIFAVVNVQISALLYLKTESTS